MEGKKTRGRQKIEMKMIENDDDKLVTFSKRRSGIYKKATELVTLTGSELAFVVYSPAGKPFSFAHPSMESLATQFLGSNQAAGESHPTIEDHHKEWIDKINQQHNVMSNQLDLETKKVTELKMKLRGVEKGWWNAPVEELNMEDLLQLEAAFNHVQIKLWDKIHKSTDGASSSSSFGARGVLVGQNGRVDVRYRHRIDLNKMDDQSDSDSNEDSLDLHISSPESD